MWRSAIDAVLDLPVSSIEWTQMEPRLRGRAIAEASRALIEQMARDERLAILVEDAHWIDAASDPAFESFGSLLARHPLLLLVTSRSNGAPEWVSRRNALVLWLRPLDDHAGVDMLDAILGPSVALSDVKRQILRHTGSVPLFIEEVCRRLRETGAIRERQGVVTFERPLDELAIPPTVSRRDRGAHRSAAQRRKKSSANRRRDGSKVDRDQSTARDGASRNGAAEPTGDARPRRAAGRSEPAARTLV